MGGVQDMQARFGKLQPWVDRASCPTPKGLDHRFFVSLTDWLGKPGEWQINQYLAMIDQFKRDDQLGEFDVDWDAVAPRHGISGEVHGYFRFKNPDSWLRAKYLAFEQYDERSRVPWPNVVTIKRSHHNPWSKIKTDTYQEMSGLLLSDPNVWGNQDTDWVGWVESTRSATGTEFIYFQFSFKCPDKALLFKLSVDV